jgi:hypothetical protein
MWHTLLCDGFRVGEASGLRLPVAGILTSLRYAGIRRRGEFGELKL